jgi:hypothetical protein
MGDNVGLDAYDADFQASAANGEVFLSIIMPTYNEGPTIRRAVCQVLSTSYPCRIELIVVDDESSDETVEQLDGLSCDRPKVCRNSRNTGRALPSQLTWADPGGAARPEKARYGDDLRIVLITRSNLHFLH